MKKSVAAALAAAFVVGTSATTFAAANPFSEVHLREAAAATTLNEFAKQCHLPVLAAVPLSRDTEHRTDHRPTLSDVRYHRRFVDEADTVVLLYRDGYYNDAGKGSPQPAEWICSNCGTSNKGKFCIECGSPRG